jgi:hypothetical protein
MSKQLQEIWKNVKTDVFFKTALVNKLKKDYQTKSWSEEAWHPITVIYAPTAIKADLDVLRYGGEFVVYPVFLGCVATSLEPIRFPISEVEGVVGLKEYEVRVSHDVVEETTVMVMAASAEEAIAKARKEDLLNEATWSLTDYIGDNQYDIVGE